MKTASGSIEIRKLFEELFNQPSLGVVLGMTDIDEVQRHFPEFLYSYPNENRIRTGIASRILYTARAGRIYEITDKQDNRDSRYLPVLPFADLTILGEWAVLIDMSGETPEAAAIKNPTVTKLFTKLFEDNWIYSEEFN